MNHLESNRESAQIVKIESIKLSSVENLCKRYDVLLVHAFPDDQELETGDVFSDREMPFEFAVEYALNNPIPNLACSTVKKGDEYNRYQGRIFGAFVLTGKIIDAYPSDANSYRFRSFNESIKRDKDLEEEIVIAIEEKNFRYNELNINTQDTILMPYLDLDYLLSGLYFGVHTPYSRTLNPNNLYGDLLRFERFCRQKSIVPIGLYKGKAIQLKFEEIKNWLTNFREELSDDREFAGKTIQSKSNFEDYLNGARSYSYGQLKSIAIISKISCKAI